MPHVRRFKHLDSYRHPDHPLPEQPPLHPEEEEQLPPDSHAARIDIPATELSTQPWNPELVEPDPLTQPSDSAVELGGLDFANLARHRVQPPPLPAALLDVTTLRSQYQQALTDYKALSDRVTIGDGPAMRNIAPRITELRQRADADRPYLLAV
ncbi:hypothetical protein [Mycobacterium ostraviense]|uniref:Uncharacterized protein n=1 Tax=Mycobacterium ostraviense TaxID=2738409 RepID=A0A164BHL1_9MYCO|nr:hypothetical protein [Mycobacterium ostraviense]KZS63498.1 hypothetical protein A4G28_09915 [Mycobacterium ostraviense]UGT92069.1 hypothetical protein LTS72_01015 [Mycobacterium ostraviense]